jgi:hypothetical protein
VTWEAVVFSTTVQDSDGDGLLDIWEDGSGYTDAVSGQWVALPGANKQVKDIFLEVDYLSDLDGSTGLPLHSHLPKKAAIDTVGAAFASTAHPINLHFDLGPRRLFRRSICDQLSGQPSQPASSGNNRAASRDRRQSNF